MILYEFLKFVEIGSQTIVFGLIDLEGQGFFELAFHRDIYRLRSTECNGTGLGCVTCSYDFFKVC